MVMDANTSVRPTVPPSPELSPVGSCASPVASTPPASRLPKKPLVSCGIEAHTIQKCPSPKKKALDPLRIMPERASYHTLFTVVARFEDHTDEYQALRSHQQFRDLHALLQKKFPKSNLPKDIPSFRKKRLDNEYIEQKTSELNEYLGQLVALTEVRQSKLLREFLDECPEAEANEDDDAVPTKMLDGLPGTIVSVRAGQSFSVSLHLQHAGDVASWQFTTKKHNIGFSATFNGTTVRVYSREESQLKPVKGSFKCTEAGTLTLDWDNTYTWSKTKFLVYWAEVDQVRTLSLHTDALGSGTELGSSVGDGSPMVDGRRAGYIAQSRNPSLYPRQIMNTSLSLITKPFTRTRHNSTSQLKTGLLIVERNVKFRGRNWYRKWFVLDARKAQLRYYDSEAASRKGLSLANMNLATKNACLAITSQDESAPTPFLFMVRARKRCWKLCAASQSEYTEWEQAISTAILTAQLKRRSKRNVTTPQTDEPSSPNEEDEESEDDDEEDDDEEEAKDDDDETDDDETDALQCPPSDTTTVSVSDVALPLPLVPDATLVEETVVVHTPVETRFCEHWLGEFCALSTAKKALVLVTLNGLVYACRSSALTMVAATMLMANAYALVHALEAPRSNHPKQD